MMTVKGMIKGALSSSSMCNASIGTQERVDVSMRYVVIVNRYRYKTMS